MRDIVPWEVLQIPEDVDGSKGAFRAPRKTCSLNADNDYQAVHAWLSLHETPATLRAYRKEAERLILWAVLDYREPLLSGSHSPGHWLHGRWLTHCPCWVPCTDG